MPDVLSRAAVATTFLALFSSPVLWAAPAAPAASAAGAAVASAAAPNAQAAAPSAKVAAPAAKSGPDERIPLRPRLAIEQHTLANGLRVVLNPDPTSPTVAVLVWYDVGSRDEKPGEGGFAHLFEHMMFEGSAGVPRGGHDQLIEGRGGKLNAQTSEDWTRYFQTMPSGELPVVLWLEADRMRALAVTEEAFENQRKVVQEEYRMRVENSPYVKGYFRLMELAYEGYHPYAHPAIGSMAELDAAKLAWVRDFHSRHYGPNNAVIVVSGDFDPLQATQLIEKWFGPIPAIKKPARPEAKFEGRTTPAGPEVVPDSRARTPAVLYAWGIPHDGTTDHYALEMAGAILVDGDSSRLRRRLVKELAVAQDVNAGTEGHRGPDVFVIDVNLAEKGKVDDVERMVWQELDDLARRGPTAAELRKARARVEHAFLFGLSANLSRAQELAKFEGHRGNATLLLSEIDRYMAVGPRDVQSAVARYLQRQRVSHVRVVPAEAPATKAAGASSSAAPAGPAAPVGTPQSKPVSPEKKP